MVCNLANSLTVTDQIFFFYFATLSVAGLISNVTVFATAVDVDVEVKACRD